MRYSKLSQIFNPAAAFFCMLFIAVCGCNDDKPLSKVEIQPEAAQLKASSRSFDNDLFSCDFSQPNHCTDTLHSMYGNFFCGFVEDDLRLAACTSDSVGRLLAQFVKDPHIAATHRAVETVFPASKRLQLDEAFTDMVQRWHHYFPDKPIPQIIYYCSAWNRSIATTDSIIGIALDCYLGPEHEITQQLSPDMFPGYIKKNMDEQYIVSDAVKGFAAWNMRNLYEEKDLLSELIFYGKIMYVAEALAPALPDSILMSWSTDQWEWARAGEEQVWKTIGNEKTMYRSKPQEINKWFADGPFTSAAGIPQESSPQLGVWMGWNIIRSYMSKYPETPLDVLLNEGDNSKLLSAYVPGKH
jgi:hypothetical protein